MLTAFGVTPASAGSANPWLERRVLNIAHQGGEDEFPSNTLYAFKKAVRAGADMLELDIGVTKDDQIIVMHDTSVDRTTNGTGLISEQTLREIQRLDAGYWFSADSGNHYSHNQDPSAYRFRGVATGDRRPPKGFKATDFRVPTLRAVLGAFPRTPINIEIKGRTKQEETAEYVYNAEVLARELADVKRDDLIVASFQQPAVDRFHELAPRIGLAPGVAGVAGWVLDGTAPPSGTVAFQIPITFKFGNTVLDVTTADNVSRAHRERYAVHTWFSGDDVDGTENWSKLVDYCVDGIMTSHPVELERTLKSHRPPAACRRGRSPQARTRRPRAQSPQESDGWGCDQAGSGTAFGGGGPT
jgi:glycerophosphoryl diester phosphodiesterase